MRRVLHEGHFGLRRAFARGRRPSRYSRDSDETALSGNCSSLRRIFLAKSPSRGLAHAVTARRVRENLHTVANLRVARGDECADPLTSTTQVRARADGLEAVVVAQRRHLDVDLTKRLC
jgi:hypothetical protein